MKYFYQLAAMLIGLGAVAAEGNEVSKSPAGGSQETRIAVADGQPDSVRYDIKPWQQAPDGGLVGKAIENILYGDFIVGEGNFEIVARLTLDELSRNGAAFVMNGIDLFGFYGQQGRFYTKGRRFGKALLETEAQKVITPGEPFTFRVVRESDQLSFYLGEERMHSLEYPWRWGGEIGFRNVRLHDFKVKANFLPLEQYLRNEAAGAPAAIPATLSAVALPEEEALVDNNWHFGWPVGIRSGDALVVVFQRGPHHSGSARPGLPSHSTAMVTRSLDGGMTWSNPKDLSDTVERVAKFAPGAMRAIGHAGDAIVYIGDQGAFRSEDDGATWKHFPDAFEGMPIEGVLNHNIGPRIVTGPEGKLYAFSHLWMNDLSFPAKWVAWISEDGGRSWSSEVWPLPEGIHAVEPAAVAIDDDLYVLGRYHPEKETTGPGTSYELVQIYLPKFDPSKAVAARTNIETTWAVDVLTPFSGAAKAAQLGGYWSQDTPDLTFNPISQRLEAVVTNRTGGAGDTLHDIRFQTLNLWSIDPGDFVAGQGQWKLEGTLLRRHAMDATKQFDGMHPASAITLPEQGEQLVILYAGYYHGPAGIFQLRRPLEIPAAPDLAEGTSPANAKEDGQKLRQKYAALGTMAGPVAPVTAREITDGRILALDPSGIRQTAEGMLERWQDSSPSAKSLIVPQNTTAPTVNADALAGHPVVQFRSDLSDYLQLPATDANHLNPGSTPMTWIAVVRPTDFTTWGTILRKGNHKESGQEGYNVATVPGGEGRYVTRIATNAGEKAGSQIPAPAAQKSGWKIYATIIAPEGIDSFVDDSESTVFGNSGSYSGVIAPEDSFFVGVNFGGGIAEIAAYNRRLSVAELNGMIAHLAEKYGLPAQTISKVD